LEKASRSYPSWIEYAVSSYNLEYPPMIDIPIITMATAYDDPNSDETYILVVNQGLTWAMI